MYKREFDNILKNALPQAVFFYGECDFLIDYYGKRMRKLIKDSHEVEEYLFYFDEYSGDMVKATLAQQSLFCPSNLVVLKLNKIATKKTKGGDFGEFLEILARNENNFLIVEYYNDNDKLYTKNAAAQAVLFNTKKFCNVRFFNPNKNETIEILSIIANDLGVQIARNVLLHLCEIENNHIELCVNELKKLALLGREISKDDVNKLAFGLYTNTPEELCEALFENSQRYLWIMANLEIEGILMVDLVSEMQRYFYRLFLFFASMKGDGERNSANILGYKLPPKIEEKYVFYATKLREKQYLEIFRILSEWRLGALCGREKNYFTNLIKIQAIIK